MNWQNEKNIVRQGHRRGSVMIWVMVVAIVLVLIAVVGLSVASQLYNKTTSDHTEDQAYYTALSAVRTVASYIESGTDESAAFVGAANLPTTGDSVATGKTYDLSSQLPSTATEQTANSCTVNVKWDTSPEPGETTSTDLGKKLLLTATATFAGNTETVTLTLRKGTLGEVDPTILEKTENVSVTPPTFKMTKYDDEASELNKFTPALPVFVGNQDVLSSGGSSTNGNTVNNVDSGALSTYITTPTSLSEARFVPNFNQFTSAPSGGNHDGIGDGDAYAFSLIQGTIWHYACNAERSGTSGYYDYRRFLSGQNGLMAFNPSIADDYPDDNSNTEIVKPDNNTNTKFSMLPLGDTKGKDIKIRLSSDNVGTGLNISNLKYSQQTRARYNAVIGLDLTDTKSATTNENIDVRIDAEAPLHTWYPADWKSGTIYTQNKSDEAINTRLVFTPFVHTFRLASTSNSYGIDQIFFDFWSWGNYRANSKYGGSIASTERAQPQLGNKGASGMPIVPINYGPNFSMYLTDNIGSSDADKQNPNYRGNMAWLTQGVNVIGESAGEDLNGNGIDGEKSVLYSNRGLTLGGALHKSSWSESLSQTSAGYTVENVNSTFDGWATRDGWDNSRHYSDFIATDFITRYESAYLNTDLILKTPSGASTPRYSVIKKPAGWRDIVASSESSTNFTNWRKMIQNFDSYTKFIGGDIYVGTGQTLTIEGGDTIHKNPNGTLASSTWTDTGDSDMIIAPNAISVMSGASLILQSSKKVNVTTKILASGSTLTFDAGAKYKGNLSATSSTVTIGKATPYNTTDIPVIEGDIKLNGGTFVTTGASATPQIKGDIHAKNAEITIGTGSNIEGDIYLDGGTCTILSGTTIKGNIYVYNGAQLKILDTITLNSKHTIGSAEAARDGILVFAHGSVVSSLSDYLDSPGKVSINTGKYVNGTANKIHLVGGTVTNSAVSGTLPNDNTVLCNNRDATTGNCHHFSSDSGWYVGKYTVK